MPIRKRQSYPLKICANLDFKIDNFAVKMSDFFQPSIYTLLHLFLKKLKTLLFASTHKRKSDRTFWANDLM